MLLNSFIFEDIDSQYFMAKTIGKTIMEKSERVRLLLFFVGDGEGICNATIASKPKKPSSVYSLVNHRAKNASSTAVAKTGIVD